LWGVEREVLHSVIGLGVPLSAYLRLAAGISSGIKLLGCVVINTRKQVVVNETKGSSRLAGCSEKQVCLPATFCYVDTYAH
jgi:hypothetical protein